MNQLLPILLRSNRLVIIIPGKQETLSGATSGVAGDDPCEIICNPVRGTDRYNGCISDCQNPALRCENGRYRDETLGCISCPNDQGYNPVTGKCEPCPSGQFHNNTTGACGGICPIHHVATGTFGCVPCFGSDRYIDNGNCICRDKDKSFIPQNQVCECSYGMINGRCKTQAEWASSINNS